MSLLKKQTAGSLMTLLALLLAVAALIVYNVNIAGEGYFQNAAVRAAVTYPVIAIVLLALALVVGLLPVSGIAAAVTELLSGVMRIAAPACCVAAAMFLIDARGEGFAFIYFSNEEVLQEVQTAANLSSAHGAIANVAVLAAAALVGIIAAFFGMRKKTA
ncbi:MAG: hypothetical protein Q4C60_05910 [Eubacteriales bacterium]|nr:hypothetical protein [Eubacteriales bacterium]